jgi:hypothetical protein
VGREALLARLRRLAGPRDGLGRGDLLPHPAVVRAARRLYGGLETALKAAGLRLVRRRRQAYSPQELLALLRERAEAGVLCARHVRGALGAAARRLFGSLQQAAWRAGLELRDARCRREPTADEVSQDLLAMSRRPGGLPGERVALAENGRLVRAARRHFGTWARAALEARVPLDQLPKARWDEEMLLAAMGRLLRQGEPLAGPGGRRLRKVARRLGIPWREAVERAGGQFDVRLFPAVRDP